MFYNSRSVKLLQYITFFHCFHSQSTHIFTCIAISRYINILFLTQEEYFLFFQNGLLSWFRQKTPASKYRFLYKLIYSKREHLCLFNMKVLHVYIACTKRENGLSHNRYSAIQGVVLLLRFLMKWLVVNINFLTLFLINTSSSQSEVMMVNGRLLAVELTDTYVSYADPWFGLPHA